MAVKPSGRKSHLLVGAEREYSQQDKKDEETSPAGIVDPGSVAGWEQGNQTPSAGSILPLWSLRRLPCSCLSIIISDGLCIVHRGSSCQPESCFSFVKRVPGAQEMKGSVERQETLKGGEENGFCQVVCTISLLSSSLLKIIALGP